MRQPDSARRSRVGAAPARARLGLLLGVAVVAAVLLGTAGRASAASNGLWSVFPTNTPGQRPQAYLTPELTPGKLTFGSVTIDNFTLSPLTLDLYAADAFNTPGGALSLRRQTDPQVGIGRWTHLALSQVTVPAGGSSEVPFVIATPADASPGDHVGGIVAEETQGVTSRSGGLQVTVLEAVAVRVYARVRGPISPRLTLSHLSLALTRTLASQFGGAVGARVRFRVRNSGNTVLTPTVRVALTTPFGAAGRPRTLTLPQLLPGSAVSSSVDIAGVPALLHVRATVSVRAVGAQAIVTTARWMPPWGLIVLVVLALALLLGSVLLLLARRRRRRDVRKGEQATLQDAGDNRPEASAVGGPGRL